MRPNNSKTSTSPLRAQILDAALHLYSSKGYFNTSIHDVQQGADVSMGTIYNYFAGKEAIARALYDELLQRMDVVVDQAIANSEDAYGQARSIVASLFSLTETEPETVRYILNARHHEFLLNEPGICSSRPFAKMRDIILLGVERGEVRRLDPWVAASMAFGPALRMISLRLDGMIPTPLPEMMDALWETTWLALRIDE
ncbi:MAG: TetR/AcrR family transcriptional regulator [Anaerolineae bacterium]|nr:TetR/AcrR family transcriptional regulator [Anaerolineae bacterium]